MSRITRNTRRLAQLDDDDADLVLRLSQSQRSHADPLEEDDDLNLFLSQTQNTQLNESAVSDLASSTNNIQVNIARIEEVIKNNHGAFTKQHEVLLNLVSDISVNVSEISDKVNKLERKLIVTQKSMNNNKEVLDNVIVDIEMMKKTMNTIKQRQNKSMKHEEYEERLKTVESKLKEHENNRLTNRDDDDDNDATIIVRNLPYRMMDDADGHQLLSEGLGLDIPVQSVHRARSVNHQAGVLTIELTCAENKQKVIANKMKLSRTQRYYDVFIDGGKTNVNRRIEQKFEMLVNNLRGRRPDSYAMAARSRTYYNRNRYRQ